MTLYIRNNICPITNLEGHPENVCLTCNRKDFSEFVFNHTIRKCTECIQKEFESLHTEMVLLKQFIDQNQKKKNEDEKIKEEINSLKQYIDQILRDHVKKEILETTKKQVLLLENENKNLKSKYEGELKNKEQKLQELEIQKNNLQRQKSNNSNKAIVSMQQDSYEFFKRGLAKYLTARYKDAVIDFNSVLQIDPDNIIIKYFLADSYYEDEQYNIAITLFDNIIKQDNKFAAIYLLRGNSKNKLNISGAMEDYSKANEIYPEIFGNYVKEGIDLLAKKIGKLFS